MLQISPNDQDFLSRGIFMWRTNVHFVLSAVSLAMMMSTPLSAQVTPVPPPTIVPLMSLLDKNLNYVPLQGENTPLAPVSWASITLSQGQMLRVFGSVVFTSNAETTQGSTDYVSALATCSDPSGNTAKVEQDIGENFLGPNAPPGPNYPVKGYMVLSPSTLIMATIPGTGSYFCQLQAAAEKPGTVVSNQGVNKTFLGFSAPIDPPDAFSWGTFGACIWKGPNVGTGQDEAHDDKDCMYLGGANGAQSVDLFSPSVLLQTVPTVPPSPPRGCSPAPCAWNLAPPSISNAPPGASNAALTRPAIETNNSPEPAAFVDVSATLQVSMCGKITDECYFARFGSNDTTSVTIDSYVELDQYDAAGQLVHTSSSPTQETVIVNLTHHDMIYHSISNVPVYPSSGPPQFKPKLVVTWIHGSTAKVDQVQVVAFTSFHGHAQFVPNVVGANVSAATNTLIASGYTAGVLTNVISTAAPGTVVSQSPVGNSVIEAPGSPVNLSVSAPSVSVPNVIGLSETKAAANINAALLVPKVTFEKICTYLGGNVGRESPKGESVVPAGSTINITVDTGTRATCGPPK